MTAASSPDVSPFIRFRDWMAEAEKAEPNDPNAMVLATAAVSGRPSARTVLLKGLDERGFVFYTNKESRKGNEISANREVSLLFYWKSLRRQIRIEGAVEDVTDAEANSYFASRARISRLGAWASDQSRPLPDRSILEHRLAELERSYLDDIPRPEYWSGYRVLPTSFEFWQEMPYRLHDRTLFTRDVRSSWTQTKLFP